MKGTEKIIAHISSNAQAQADAILAQAEQQCAEIRAEYSCKAKEIYSDKIRAGVKDCEDRAGSIDRIAKMEARKGMLALKQELVSEGFSRAVEKIADLPEDRYVDFLAGLAAKSSVTGDEQLVFNEKDKAAVGSRVVAKANAMLSETGKNGDLSICEDTGNFAGGLILRRGNIEDNCTVELLVDLCRGEMASELAGVLFS